jgi:hypothetical protein
MNNKNKEIDETEEKGKLVYSKPHICFQELRGWKGVPEFI